MVPPPYVWCAEGRVWHPLLTPLRSGPLLPASSLFPPASAWLPRRAACRHRHAPEQGHPAAARVRERQPRVPALSLAAYQDLLLRPWGVPHPPWRRPACQLLCLLGLPGGAEGRHGVSHLRSVLAPGCPPLHRVYVSPVRGWHQITPMNYFRRMLLYPIRRAAMLSCEEHVNIITSGVDQLFLYLVLFNNTLHCICWKDTINWS